MDANKWVCIAFKNKSVKQHRDQCEEHGNLVETQTGTTFLEDNLAVYIKSFIKKGIFSDSSTSVSGFYLRDVIREAAKSSLHFN